MEPKCSNVSVLVRASMLHICPYNHSIPYMDWVYTLKSFLLPLMVYFLRIISCLLCITNGHAGKHKRDLFWMKQKALIVLRDSGEFTLEQSMALFTTIPPKVTPSFSLIKLLILGEVSFADFSHIKSLILNVLFY